MRRRILCVLKPDALAWLRRVVRTFGAPWVNLYCGIAPEELHGLVQRRPVPLRAGFAVRVAFERSKGGRR